MYLKNAQSYDGSLTWLFTQGNLKDLEAHFRKGYAINQISSDPNFRTYLSLAIEYKRNDFLAWLLQNGADPNYQEEHGEASLYTILILNRGSPALIKFLLSYGMKYSKKISLPQKELLEEALDVIDQFLHDNSTIFFMLMIDGNVPLSARIDLAVNFIKLVDIDSTQLFTLRNFLSKQLDFEQVIESTALIFKLKRLFEHLPLEQRPEIKAALISAFAQRQDLPFSYLISLFEDASISQDSEIKVILASALAQRQDLYFRDLVDRLFELLRVEQNPLGRAALASALAQREDLYSVHLSKLFELLKVEQDPQAKSTLASALAQRQDLSPDHLSRLFELLHAERDTDLASLLVHLSLEETHVEQNPEVKARATLASALAQSQNLSSAHLDRLFELLREPSPEIRATLASALAQRQNLSSAQLNLLFQILDNEINPKFRTTLASALIQRQDLSPAQFGSLSYILKAESSENKATLASALAQRQNLSAAHLNMLFELLHAEKNLSVKTALAFVLAQQEALDSEHLKKLFQLLYDRRRSQKFRMTLAICFAKKGEVPEPFLAYLHDIISDDEIELQPRLNLALVLFQRSDLSQTMREQLSSFFLIQSRNTQSRTTFTSALAEQQVLPYTLLELITSLIKDTTINAEARAKLATIFIKQKGVIKSQEQQDEPIFSKPMSDISFGTLMTFIKNIAHEAYAINNYFHLAKAYAEANKLNSAIRYFQACGELLKKFIETEIAAQTPADKFDDTFLNDYIARREYCLKQIENLKERTAPLLEFVQEIFPITVASPLANKMLPLTEPNSNSPRLKFFAPSPSEDESQALLSTLRKRK